MDVPTTPSPTPVSDFQDHALQDLRAALFAQAQEAASLRSTLKDLQADVREATTPRKKRDRTILSKLEEAEQRLAWAVKPLTPLQRERVLKDYAKKLRAQRLEDEDF